MSCKKCEINSHSKAAVAMVALVWPSLKKDREHADRRETSWGTKTECGLAACFDLIIDETPTHLTPALKNAEACLRLAAQVSKGRVDKQKVGGWLHHADELQALINKAERTR